MKLIKKYLMCLLVLACTAVLAGGVLTADENAKKISLGQTGAYASVFVGNGQAVISTQGCRYSIAPNYSFLLDCGCLLPSPLSNICCAVQGIDTLLANGFS